MNDENHCNQLCTNTYGSYLCYCEEGYELAIEGGFTCIGWYMICLWHNYYYIRYIDIDSDECLVNNGGCDQECNNYEGGYSCTCEEGFRLDDDNVTCKG